MVSLCDEGQRLRPDLEGMTMGMSTSFFLFPTNSSRVCQSANHACSMYHTVRVKLPAQTHAHTRYVHMTYDILEQCDTYRVDRQKRDSNDIFFPLGGAFAVGRERRLVPRVLPIVLLLAFFRKPSEREPHSVRGVSMVLGLEVQLVAAAALGAV